MPLFTSSGIFSGTSVSGKNGGIIQTVYNRVNSVQSVSGNGANISALNTSITPVSASSRIIVWVNLGMSSGNTNSQTYEIRRNGSSINDHRGDASGSRPRRTFRGAKNWFNDSNHGYALTFAVEDFPQTTSSVEYRLYAHPESNNTTYLNRNANNSSGSDNYHCRTMCNMILFEVGDA